MPKCSDDDSLDVIRKITYDQLEKNPVYGTFFSNMKKDGNLSFSFDAIVHRGSNPDTKIRSCSAHLIIHAINLETKEPTKSEVPITYNISPTDDGNNFVVEVFGL